MNDQMLVRNLRYLNYAEELRIIATAQESDFCCDALMRTAGCYDRLAASLDSILRAKASIES